jgi:hypothetical protein
MAFSANHYIQLAVLVAVFKAFRAEFVSHINYVLARKRTLEKARSFSLQFQYVVKIRQCFIANNFIHPYIVQNIRKSIKSKENENTKIHCSSALCKLKSSNIFNGSNTCISYQL